MMQKIIWISSYPKSGNTWIMFLIANYFFNIERKDNFEIVNKNIIKFPPASLIKKFTTKKELIENPYNISKYWLKAQEQAKIINGNFVFLKNHNALVSVNGNEFTNENFSLASIYIIRDPRDVVVSYAHYSNLAFDKVIQNLCDKSLYYNLTHYHDFPDIEILGSWKFHYISWRDGVPNMPKIIVRYEDLIKDSYSCFYKIINFLSKILNFKLDEEQIKFSVENSKFEKLQNNENKFGYIKNNSNTNFFHSGKIQQWKNILNKSQIKTIENKFKEEMELLGYL